MKVGVITDVNKSARFFRLIIFVCDAASLRAVFTKLGFTVVVHKDLTAEDILNELKILTKRNFVNEDALVRGLTACLYISNFKNMFNHINKKVLIHM